MTYKEYFKFQETKDHLINKLNMTDEEKAKVINFFQKHPNYESKIDWNRKDLTFNDFKELLALEGTTKSAIKKYGISGKTQIENLQEGKDYDIIKATPEYTLYYIKTFKASEVLAKPTTPPEGITGGWCISGKNYSPGTQDQHWKNYKDRDIEFFFFFTKDSKYAIAAYPNNTFSLFNSEDREVYELPFNIDSEIEEAMLRIKKEKEEAFLKAIEGLPKGNLPKHWIQYDKLVGPSRKERVFLEKRFFSLKVPEGVREIEEGAFAKCRTLTEIEIPGSVITIGAEAFRECTSLTKATLSEGITIIQPYAFESTALKEIEIPKSVFLINTYAFGECFDLEKVILHEGLEFLGFRAFTFCNKLEELEIPDTVKRIASGAFSGCQSLKKISLPKNLEDIEKDLFLYCGSLEEIAIPDGISKIGTEAFLRCKNLRTVTIPKSVTVIEYKAFRDCPNLEIFYKGTQEEWEKVRGSFAVGKYPVNFIEG